MMESDRRLSFDFIYIRECAAASVHSGSLGWSILNTWIWPGNSRKAFGWIANISTTHHTGV